MNVTIKDLVILLALESNPLMSFNELSTKVKVSWPTVKKRVNALRASGVLRHPFVILRAEALGLQRVNVLANVSDMRKLRVLETACDLHPYTVYRSRFYGGGFGLFMQFNIPLNTNTLLKEFFHELREEQIIDSFSVLESTGLRLNTFPNLKKFNLDTSTWDFSWKDWIKALNKIRRGSLPSPPMVEQDFSEFKEIQFKFLQELTMKADVRQTDLMAKFKLSKSETHRQYMNVMKRFVQDVRLNYNRDVFDLTETYLAVIHDIPSKSIPKIYYGVKEHAPPFRMSLDVIEHNKILIWSNMSPSQATQFAFELWETYQNVMIFNLNTKDEGAVNYWFYPDNFDFKKKQWKTSRVYMLDSVLKELREKRKNHG